MLTLSNDVVLTPSAHQPTRLARTDCTKDLHCGQVVCLCFAYAEFAVKGRKERTAGRGAGLLLDDWLE